MASQVGDKNDEGPTYIVYDLEADKIIGAYSKYDDAGHRVCCAPDEVRRASLGASDKSMEGRYLVLEVKEYEGREQRNGKADTQGLLLVTRRSRPNRAVSRRRLRWPVWQCAPQWPGMRSPRETER